MSRSLVLMLILAALCLMPFSARPQQDESASTAIAEPTVTPPGQGSGGNPSDQLQPVGKPYLAKLKIDTDTPATYGDDVVISVWISPAVGIDLKEIRLHPKGSLVALYYSRELVSNADNKGVSDKPELKAGVPCTTGVQNAKPNVPIVAACRLVSKSTGIGRVFNWNAVLMGRDTQQYEIEVVTRQATKGTFSYFEFGTVEFVSPMLSVVIGGILGAGLWTMFLPISAPLPTVSTVPVESWNVLLKRIWDALPQLFLRWCSFLGGFLRSTVLGGTTALVLIILAKTTEGLDTPIALQVQDLWGGLLVGIFSTPLAKWIRGKVEKVMQGT